MNSENDTVKESIISALRYHYDGVDGKEEENEKNNTIADKIQSGEIQIVEKLK